MQLGAMREREKVSERERVIKRMEEKIGNCRSARNRENSTAKSSERDRYIKGMEEHTYNKRAKTETLLGHPREED